MDWKFRELMNKDNFQQHNIVLKTLISLVISLSMLMWCCVSSPRYVSHVKIQEKPEIAQLKKFVNPKRIDVYIPEIIQPQENWSQEGLASYYAEDFHGKLTANGEIFDMNAITAAHKELPLDSKVKVIDLDTGKSIIVRINDRGPYIENRIIDLSKASAEKLGILQSGVARVTIEVVEWGDNRYKKQ